MKDKFIDARQLRKDIKRLAKRRRDPKLKFSLTRTFDFVERKRRIPHSWYGTETFHAKKPHNSYRTRQHSKNPHLRNHQRNYRPEIPWLKGNGNPGFSGLEAILDSVPSQEVKPFVIGHDIYFNLETGPLRGTYRLGQVVGGIVVNPKHYGMETDAPSQFLIYKALFAYAGGSRYFFYDSNRFFGKFTEGDGTIMLQLEINEQLAYVNPVTLQPMKGSAIQMMLEYLDKDDGVQRYNRSHSNEEQQSRPKIPFREISAIREISHKMRRAKYMLVNAPAPYDGEAHKVVIPSPRRNYHKGATMWSYIPIVKM